MAKKVTPRETVMRLNIGDQVRWRASDRRRPPGVDGIGTIKAVLIGDGRQGLTLYRVEFSSGTFTLLGDQLTYDSPMVERFSAGDNRQVS